MSKFNLKTLFGAFQAASRIAAPMVRGRALLTRISFQRRSSAEDTKRKETPDSPAYLHFEEQRLQKKLPEAVFHLFDRSGLRAWGDDYKLVTAQAAELGIDTRSANTLLTKTETAGVTFFFGDGYVWVEMGGLGMELLQKGKN